MKIIQFIQRNFKTIALSVATVTMFALCVWVGSLPHVPVTSYSTIGAYGPGGVWQH
jgi:hypothetical protein